MIKTDNTFKQWDLDILKSFIGSTVASYDAAIAARDDMAWQTVRIHTDKGALDLTNTLATLPLMEENITEEIGVLSTRKASDDILEVDEINTETTVFPVGKRITDISVINHRIVTEKAGVAVNSRTYTQAVVLTFDDGYLVFDKGTWFDETITISRGAELDSLLYDDESDWTDDPEEDPDIHYVFESETISLQ